MDRVSSETDGRVGMLLEGVDAAIDRKQWDEAYNQVSRILSVCPDHPEALGLLAHIERRRKTTELRFEGERRTVTVVFCDLVGSSKMAELLDPAEERWVRRWSPSYEVAAPFELRLELPPSESWRFGRRDCNSAARRL